MTINNGLFTSNTDMWETPQFVFDMLNKEFGFTLDVCAINENSKCILYYSPESNSLSRPWFGVCWMNPPYGKEIYKWVEKAYNTAKYGYGTVVCLLPARTDTSWFHEYCLNADEIRYIRGRLKFGNSTNSAPFPSMIVIFKNHIS